MKRLAISVLFVLLATGILPTQAADPTSGVFGAARYIPATADGFIAFRTDTAFLDSVDALLANVSGVLADTGSEITEQASIRRGLAAGFAVSEEIVDRMLSFSGGIIAVAATEPDTGEAIVMTAVPLADGAAARDFVNGLVASNGSSLGQMGRFEAYAFPPQGYILLADDLLMTVTNLPQAEVEQLAAEAWPRLSDDKAYLTAVRALPGEDYSIGAYFNQNALDESLEPAAAGYTFGAGVAILDETTYALDISTASAAVVPPPLAVDPQFARNIPSTMGAVIHGADLAALVRNMLPLFEASDPQIRANLDTVLAVSGTNLAELLSWTKGDFALAGRIDIRSILPSLLAVPPNLRGLPRALDIALIVEAVDPVKAKAFAASLASLVRTALDGSTGMSISEEIINGVPVTVLIAEMTVGTGLGPGSTVTFTFEFALGASDRVFALGTADAVRAIFSGRSSVLDNADYLESIRYKLPGASNVWTIDGATAVNLATLGIQNFSTSNALLGSADQAGALMDRLSRFLHAVTVSTTVIDGVPVLRAAIRLEE